MSDQFKITTRGQGPELVLIHGWAMHSGIWGGIVDALATGFRVNLVDLPGHGVNRHIPMRRDLDAVTELILSEVPPAAWIGWSLGGLVTLAAAIQQPRQVQKMILVAATPSFSKQTDWDCGVDQSAQQAFSKGLENDFAATINQFCVQTFGANRVQESLNRLGGSSITEQLPTKNTLYAGLHLLYSTNLLPKLSECKIPSLFLGGSRDRTVRPESFAEAASLMPNAEAKLIPGAGHVPFISHKDEFLATIREFLLAERLVLAERIV